MSPSLFQLVTAFYALNCSLVANINPPYLSYSFLDFSFVRNSNLTCWLVFPNFYILSFVLHSQPYIGFLETWMITFFSHYFRCLFSENCYLLMQFFLRFESVSHFTHIFLFRFMLVPLARLTNYFPFSCFLLKFSWTSFHHNVETL